MKELSLGEQYNLAANRGELADFLDTQSYDLHALFALSLLAQKGMTDIDISTLRGVVNNTSDAIKLVESQNPKQLLETMKPAVEEGVSFSERFGF